jgi:hypothetical protein
MKLQTGVDRALTFALALAVLLLAAWLAYRPGIRGAFLLDDFSGLSNLASNGPITHWAAFWRYVTSGNADPTGRPLGMLSFLIDARDWPAAAGPFKFTNILLHLLNGVLLCWAILGIARRSGFDERRAATMALIGSGIWLLHPLLVSTTLYVVQREAMLPATFTFIGIICWCRGRDALDIGKLVCGVAWMAIAAWLCTILAIMAKANGILLPLLLVMAEMTVLREDRVSSRPGQRVHRAAGFVLLGLPTAALVAYLIWVLPAAAHIAAAERPWSLGQRLLTEPRILTDYLRMLWIPQTDSGLFYDQIRPSTDLLHPWTTLPCMVFITGLIVCGWLVRRRHSWVAFAIIFYFAGQTLESTFIPVELAFEHRNYLPAAFMFVPIAVWLSAPRTKPLPWRLATTILLVLLAGMTWIRAGIWGDVSLQAGLWGRMNPDSPQSQTFAAEVKAASGKLPSAIDDLRAAAMRMPDQPQITLTLVNIECHRGTIDPPTWNLAIHSLRTTKTGWNNIANWVITHIPDASDHRCGGLTMASLHEALSALQSNPKFKQFHQDDPAFKRADAAMHLAEHQPGLALADFESLLAKNPNAASAYDQAHALGSAGYPRLALKLLDHYDTLPKPRASGFGMPRLHAWVLRRQHYRQHEIAHLRKSLQAAASGDAPSP